MTTRTDTLPLYAGAVMNRSATVCAGLALMVVGLVGCTSTWSGTASGSTAVPTAVGGGAAASTSSPTEAVAASDPTATAEVPVATDTPVPTISATEVVVTVLAWSDLRDQVEAAAYVSGTPRAEGTCTLVLSRDGVEVTADLPALPDATATSCGDLAIPADRVESGGWTGRVDYELDGVTVSSEEIEVEVP